MALVSRFSWIKAQTSLWDGACHTGNIEPSSHQARHPEALFRNYTWGLVIWPWFNEGVRGGEDREFGFSKLKKKIKESFTHPWEGSFCVCRQFVVQTEDNAHFPISTLSSLPISSLFFCRPALLSWGPFALHSLIKRFVIPAQCGSLPAPACCDLSSFPLQTCSSEAGSIGVDSAHKAEVTGRDYEKGERDLWRIQFKTSHRFWLS